MVLNREVMGLDFHFHHCSCLVQKELEGSQNANKETGQEAIMVIYIENVDSLNMGSESENEAKMTFSIYSRS